MGEKSNEKIFDGSKIEIDSITILYPVLMHHEIIRLLEQCREKPVKSGMTFKDVYLYIEKELGLPVPEAISECL